MDCALLYSRYTNLGLGYTFSLLYRCVYGYFVSSGEHYRVQKFGRYQFAGGGLLFPFAQFHGAPNQYIAGIALHQYGRVDRNPDDFSVAAHLVGIFILRSAP